MHLPATAKRRILGMATVASVVAFASPAGAASAARTRGGAAAAAAAAAASASSAVSSSQVVGNDDDKNYPPSEPAESPQQRRRELSSCLETWTVSVTGNNGRNQLCDLQTFLDEASALGTFDSCGSATTPLEQLELIYDVVGFDAVSGPFRSDCVKAYETERTLDWDAITGRGAAFDKEYFDGGTYYNEERQTYDEYGLDKHKLRDEPGARIRNIQEDFNKNQKVGFPASGSGVTNVEDCEMNAVMCCWAQDRQANDNNGNCNTPYDENCVDSNPADNTDVCLVDMSRSADSNHIPAGGGMAIYRDNAEEDSHCHGFAWSETDPLHKSHRFKGNNLFFVSQFDHLYTRGYVRDVPGAPMCGCVEKMPVATRADCTQVDVQEETIRFSYDANTAANNVVATVVETNLKFNACQGANNKNNDLRAYVQRLRDDGDVPESYFAQLQNHLVQPGNCPDTLATFLDSKGLEKIPGVYLESVVYGQRLYAKTGQDGESGVGAIASTKPRSEDQLWQFHRQPDELCVDPTGAYVGPCYSIVNYASERRLYAMAEGRNGIDEVGAAKRSTYHWPDQRWRIEISTCEHGDDANAATIPCYQFVNVHSYRRLGPLQDVDDRLFANPADDDDHFHDSRWFVYKDNVDEIGPALPFELETVDAITPPPTPTPTGAPTISMKPTYDKMWVVCGDSKDCNLEDRAAELTELHEVRCCSDVDRPDYTKVHAACDVWAASEIGNENLCHAGRTYFEAEAACDGDGARLCTRQELSDDCTSGTGCAFNKEQVWSSTGSTDPPTTSPTITSMPTVTARPTDVPPESHFVACGSTIGECSRDPHVPYVAAYNDELHEVRCCSETERAGWVKKDWCDVWGESDLPTCIHAATYTEAVEHCEALGAGVRLCTMWELLDDCTRGSGCAHDNDHIWSSTQSDPTPAPTTSPSASPSRLTASPSQSFAPTVPAGSVVGETGRIAIENSVDHGVVETVAFRNPDGYKKPVVVAFINTRNGTETVAVRVRAVAGTGFEIFMQEPDNEEHNKEVVSYIVMEEGSWYLEGGLSVQAGSVVTSEVHRSGMEYDGIGEEVELDDILPGSDDPVVLASLQTHNEADFMSTFVTGVSENGFRVGQEALQTYKDHKEETIGWVAFSSPNATGTLGTSSSSSSFLLGYQHNESPDPSNGVDDAAFFIDLTPGGFAETPDVIVGLYPQFGIDGSFARGAGSWTKDDQTVYAEEDQLYDSERNHAAEPVVWAAFAPNSDFVLAPHVTKPSCLASGTPCDAVTAGQCCSGECHGNGRCV